MVCSLLATNRPVILIHPCSGQEVGSGLLYYTQSDEVIRVVRGRHELRSLVQSRNSMAAFLMRRQTGKGETPAEPLLPPTLDEERVCKKCYAVDGCMLYRRVRFPLLEDFGFTKCLVQAVEDVDDKTSEIGELYNLKTGHLTQEQCDFFKQWESLISLEEQEMLRFRKELWLLGSQDREKAGRCFADMVIKECKLENGPGVSKIHRYTYTFVRKPLASKKQVQMQPSLLNGHITKGDAVSISIEPNLLALSRGFVLELHPTSVVLGVDHELDVGSLLARSRRSTTRHAEDAVFRIDKDEMAAGIGRIRDNLAKLFYVGGDGRRCALVVDLRAPAFDETVLEIERQRLKDEKEGVLNENQKEAMVRVLAAKDYAIVLGMPGTGKTTTIAEIIKELVRRGKTVLLSSHTHSAVDTILSKLFDVDFEILRLGNADKACPFSHFISKTLRS
jgi:DNA replication ATP-dependent helicase Dna2